MRIIFSGVPGVGKTKVMELLRELDPEFVIIGLGELMAKIGGLSSRDEIRKMRPEEIIALRAKALETIEGRKIILDTHLSVKTKYGYLPGMPLQALNIFKPELIVIREERPSVILSRRSLDRLTGARTGRDNESEEEIEEHQRMNRLFAAACSVITGCPIKIYRGVEASKIAEDLYEMVGGKR
ncbi:MAG: AAA family ATPase [Candidatus Micrarchaeota archaeon]|nr:AAA family ATPase [Candidatus Micrarchaeota archaeon]